MSYALKQDTHNSLLSTALNITLNNCDVQASLTLCVILKDVVDIILSLVGFVFI